MSLNKVLYNVDQRADTSAEERARARNNIGAATPIYKGVMFIEISGSVIDSSGEIIVSDMYNHDGVTGQPNTMTITYKEVDGHASDYKPSIYYDSDNSPKISIPSQLAALQKSLVAGTTLFITSHSGYELTDMAYWGHDRSSKAIAGALNRNFLLSNGNFVLSNGARLDTAKSSTISSSYRIEIAIEYLYTSNGV